MLFAQLMVAASYQDRAEADSCLVLQADNITVPGIGGSQQLVVTSTGLNNQSNLLGQATTERLQSVRKLLACQSTCVPAHAQASHWDMLDTACITSAKVRQLTDPRWPVASCQPLSHIPLLNA